MSASGSGVQKRGPILCVMAKERKKFKKERPVDPSSIRADWRLFLAVPMPQPAVDLVDEIVVPLSTADMPVRWVAPDTAHLTLHFLGDTSPERAELLRMALGQIISRHTAFSLETGGLGVFPNERAPRVVWLGLRGPSERLVRLQSDLASALRALEFPVEDRALHPHITLGRVRDTASSGFPVQLQRRFADPAIRDVLARPAVPVPVSEVLLVRSILSRDGARHEPIVRFPLGSPT